jgi:Mg-chelatase subunit ChlD
MFTCTVFEAFGPFCGMGGYGQNTATVMHRSPKRAVELAQRKVRRMPDVGGGVPILSGLKLTKGTTVLVDRMD